MPHQLPMMSSSLRLQGVVLKPGILGHSYCLSGSPACSSMLPLSLLVYSLACSSMLPLSLLVWQPACSTMLPLSLLVYSLACSSMLPLSLLVWQPACSTMLPLLLIVCNLACSSMFLSISDHSSGKLHGVQPTCPSSQTWYCSLWLRL